MDSRKRAASYIAGRILEGETGLEMLKKEASRRFGLSEFLRNSFILENFPKSRLTPRISLLLKRKPVRTLSGVAPVAVMISPENSCRWACVYCPYTGKAPKSYTGSEPAAMRAIDNAFDPAAQVKSRLRQFELNGHPTDKCDVIVMGGTFLSTPRRYRRKFVKGIYDALNGRESAVLGQAKKLNESARHRMVGLAFETRPDVCGEREIDEMLSFGATKVELGVQHPSNPIYEKINRGHKVGDVVRSTRLLKDSAFKVAYHLMPGLPGSSPRKDVAMFRKVFSDARFMPDMLKIYPTLVLPGTALHGMMEAGEYEPYSDEQAADVIAKAYEFIPPYARVMRIQRDIPSNLISKGVRKSNLREIVETRLASSGARIPEIRVREAGMLGECVRDPVLRRLNYSASRGKEVFLSIEDKKSRALAAFLRLRIPGRGHRREIDRKTSLVRELHVYGEAARLGKKGKIQHRGFGSLLLSEAEKISREEFEMKKILVISAVGARPYYFAKGYRPDGPYVSRRI